MITHVQLDILECEVKQALGSITTNKPSGDDTIPAELFQFLKDGSVKVLHSKCQQIWKTQQCRGNPACQGTFGGRIKAGRILSALQGGRGDFP